MTCSCLVMLEKSPDSIRTLRHLDVKPGPSRELFKLTGSIRVIHPFGVFVDRIVRQLIGATGTGNVEGLSTQLLEPGWSAARLRVFRTATSTAAKYGAEAIGAVVLANLARLLGKSVTRRPFDFV